MSDHTHLDQQRRPRGECPGCDLLWCWQDEQIDECRWEECAAQHGKADRRRLWLLGRRRYEAR